MEKIRRQLNGQVVSAKAAKTVIVQVDGIKVHPKYHKRYKVSKKYPSRTDIELVVGDKVVIEESRPLSKTVHWKVISKQ